MENTGASVSWADGSDIMQSSTADICFADDETIIAVDAIQLQDMMDTVVTDLKRVGLKVSAAKTSWMGVNIGESNKVMMGDVEIPRYGQLTLLGSIIRCDGNMTHEVAARIAKGWTYYHTFRYIFENRFVFVKMRILVWEKIVMMFLLWGLETASLSKTLRKKMDRCQHQMFSRIARMRRKWSADESWLDFEKRKVRMGRYLVQKHSILLSDRLLSKVFSWAGHEMYATRC